MRVGAVGDTFSGWVEVFQVKPQDQATIFQLMAK
jgi:hypothetical protein